MFYFIALCYIFFFFFSSRRRHTRFSRDWSSDVCSSDLPFSAIQVMIAPGRQGVGLSRLCLERMRANAAENGFEHLVAPVRPSRKAFYRSEERRVGKECRSRG